MALPMPHVAAVTSALLPCRSLSCMNSPLKLFESGLHGSRVGDRKADQILVDALREAIEHLARAAFHDMGDALRLHGLDGFDPAHGVPGLTYQRIANGVG